MILVVGSTGRLGGIITLRLLAEGRPVRILVDPHSNYQPLAEAGTQPVFGDFLDRRSLDAACDGITAVVTTANSPLYDGDDTSLAYETRGNQNLIDAAKASGVRQFVFISSAEADPKSELAVFARKGETEQYLIESGVPYTILAPGAFTEVWIGMVVAAPVSRDLPVTVYGPARHSFISISDVANFAIAVIGSAAAINQRLVLGGPEAISFEEAAGVFSRLLGRNIPVIQIDPGKPLPCVPEELIPLIASYSLDDWIVTTERLARTYHVELTPFETTARAMLVGMRVAAHN